jgi:hypothetical protein
VKEHRKLNWRNTGYSKEGKSLSGYQKIRVQVIRTAGYQVEEQEKEDGRQRRATKTGGASANLGSTLSKDPKSQITKEMIKS